MASKIEANRFISGCQMDTAGPSKHTGTDGQKTLNFLPKPEELQYIHFITASHLKHGKISKETQGFNVTSSCQYQTLTYI